MATSPSQNGQRDGPDGGEGRYEGYSHYQSVSFRVGQSIHDALEAYAYLDSRHAENARVNNEVAAEARAKMFGTALKLIPEMERERDEVEEYEDILTRWQSHHEQAEDGFLEELNRVRLRKQCPGWLLQFAVDIRTAGFELGYLKAGRNAKEEDTGAVVDTSGSAMFS